MIKRIAALAREYNTILILFFCGLFLRFLLMPWAMHADLLSMTWRSHLMAEYGSWQLPINQYLAHLLFGINLLSMKVVGFNLPSLFPEQFGLVSGSLTASVGNWLTFNEKPFVNEALFFFKLPNLVADCLVFFILNRLFAQRNHKTLVLAVWWFNPVNMYAFYIFARHDVLTALVILLAMAFAVRQRIWQMLVALFAAVQIRVQPLMLIPVFLVSAWKYRFNIRRLILECLLAGLIVVGYLVVTRFLPANPAAVQQLTGRTLGGDGAALVVGIPTQHAKQVTSGMAGGVPLFILGYALVGGLFFFFAKKLPQKDRLQQLNTMLLMIMSLYFAVNSFSPHYFVWLSLFIALGVGFWPKLLVPYAGAVLGWVIMGAFASDSFAINQNLFVPVSTALFRTPQIYQLAAARGIEPQSVFMVGRAILSASLLWLAGAVFVKQFWPTLSISFHQAKRTLLPICIAACLLALPAKAHAIAAPVIEVSEYNQTFSVAPGHTVGQTFVSPVNQFGSIEVRLQTDRIPGKQNLIFRLKERDQEEWLYQAEYDRNDFYNQFYYPFGFPLVEDAQGKTYYIELTLAEGSQSYPVKVLVDQRDSYSDGQMTVDGQPQAMADLSFVVVSDDTALFSRQLHQTVSEKFQDQRAFFIGYFLLLLLTVVTIFGLLGYRLRSSQ